MMRRILFFITCLSLAALACNLVEREPVADTVPAAATTTAATSVTTPTLEPSAGATVDSPTPARTISPTPSSTTAVPTPPTAAATPTPAFTPTPCPVRVQWPEYQVQRGDTMYSIAQRAGTTVDELVAANCLSSADRIFVGQQLRVPPTMVEVMPTYMPDGTNLIVYQSEECFKEPFLWDAGVSVGERWFVKTELEILTVWDGSSSNSPAGRLDRGENFIVQAGPYCYTKDIGLTTHTFRRWQMTSVDRPLTGWIDEYDVFTDFTTILPNPEVVLFDVQPRAIKSGDPLTITWEVDYANEVHIFSYHGLHRFAASMVQQEPLPSSGSMTVTLPLPLRSAQFSIFFSPKDPDHWVSVDISCSQPYFVEVGDLMNCPLGPPREAQAAYQPFENGFMVWRDNYVYVLIDKEYPNGRVIRDTWNGEEIHFDETPPPGLQQPIRGFGRVWIDDEWVRSNLGWATAAEQAYTMELQETWTAYNINRYFFTLPDGRAVNAQVAMGTSVNWEFTNRQ